MNVIPYYMARRRLLTGAGAAGSVISGYLHYADLIDTSAEYLNTFTSVPLGTAATDRVIAIAVFSLAFVGSGINHDIYAVTINGIAATQAIGFDGAHRHAEIWYAPVPTGTTGTVIVKATANLDGCAIGVYRLDANAIPSSIGSADQADLVGNTLTIQLNVPAGGVVVAGINSNVDAALSWGGIDGDYNEDASGGVNGFRRTGVASRDFAAANGAHDVSATLGGVSVVMSTTAFAPSGTAGTPQEEPSPQFLGSQASTDGTAVATFSAMDFGVEAADRVLIAVLPSDSEPGANHALTGVTIGGVAATIVVDSNPAATHRRTAIAVAEVPTGTSGDVVVTRDSTNGNRHSVHLYRATGLASVTPNDTGIGDFSLSLDVPANGFIIAGHDVHVIGALTWTGLKKRSQRDVNAQRSQTSASQVFASAQTVNVSVNDVGFNATAAASFAFS